jgi:hypothetical protein
MDEFVLEIMSRYENNEGYLDIALKDLVKSGIASEGINEDERKLIEILFDKHDNPYLLYKKKDYDKVGEELTKRTIISNTYIQGNLIKLINYVDKGRLHEEVQKIYPPNPYLVLNYN